MQTRWDYIFINYNRYRRNIKIKTKCGQQIGKALTNHESFSPSQSHETVPLKNNLFSVVLSVCLHPIRIYRRRWPGQYHSYYFFKRNRTKLFVGGATLPGSSYIIFYSMKPLNIVAFKLKGKWEKIHLNRYNFIYLSVLAGPLHVKY